MHDDPMTPQASTQDEILHVTPDATPAPIVQPPDVATIQPVRPVGRSLMPFGLAAVAAGLGLAAMAVAATVGGAGAGAGGAPTIAQGVALAANAPAAPAQDGQDGPDGQGGPGWAGPGGRGGGMMGGERMGGLRGGVPVTSISGSQLSLRTDDGWTRTIDASGATITKGGAAATLADITVGTQVRFAETRNADGTYTITKIDIEMPRVAGTVTAAGGSTITLKAMDGSTVAVTVTSATTYRVAGKRPATLADITVGDVVMATGARAADGSLTATSVHAFTPGTDGPGMGGPGMGGPGMGGHKGWDPDGNGRPGGPGRNAPNATPTPVPGT
jgi:hypothetical protein